MTAVDHLPDLTDLSLTDLLTLDSPVLAASLERVDSTRRLAAFVDALRTDGGQPLWEEATE